MPSTAAAILTRQHRRWQLALRAAVVRDILALWPAFDFDDMDGTWGPVQAALVTLVEARRAASAGLGLRYYQTLRKIEGAAAGFRPTPPPAPDRTLLAATFALLGPIQSKKNIAMNRGGEPERALSRVTGSVTRHVLNGGREAVTAAVKADPAASGWVRVTSSSPCNFCATLATRVWRSDASAFAAHDHCGCSAEPVFQT